MRKIGDNPGRQESVARKKWTACILFIVLLSILFYPVHGETVRVL
ncbi:MAG: hypothetical protein QW115_05840 [Thermoplasmata archaeon]